MQQMEMIMTDHRKHNRDCFFKYTSATTAVKILESSAVRYSSPLLFNDPFDVQSGLHFDFDIDLLPDKILERIEKLVAPDTKPNVSEADPFGQAILAMWEQKATHGFPRERMRELLRPELVLLKEKSVKLQAQYQNKWWGDFLPRLRVFSVSEDKANLLMWAHYAKDHTGVVFEFRVLAEQDNPLCVAKPAQYCRIPPPFFTEEQLIDGIVSACPIEPDAALLQYATIKSDVWVYEKEWRVWDLEDGARHPLHSDYSLYPNEIGGVYFGCRIDPDMKTAITRLLSSHPNARVFQARKAHNMYRLDFDIL
jgi:hypothetical protein